MDTITNVNIKEIPQIEEIVEGNFLIVENNNGTNIIDFNNFVVGPNNVSFYSDFQAVSSQVTQLNGSLTSQINSISASTDSLVNQKFTSLSSTIETTYSRVFYQAGVLFFNGGETVSTSVAVVMPEGVSLDMSNVSLTFNTTVTPSTTGAFVIYPTIYGTTPDYSLQANLTTPSDTPVTVSYNIIKAY